MEERTGLGEAACQNYKVLVEKKRVGKDGRAVHNKDRFILEDLV